jgi:Putative stage IV sporulation protein YqfD.
MRAARFVTGWLEAEVTGIQPEKFLQTLAERGMTFWDAAPPVDFTMHVCLPLRWAKLTPALAESVGCQARIVKLHGLPTLFARVKKRRTLLIGLLLAVACILWSSLYVWDIQIAGADGLDKGAIRASLADAGVDIGAFWPPFSQDLIRNSVILDVPTIRWMTVNIRGSHAEVIVRPMREAAKVVDEKEYVKIVATTAGIVTQVQALRGTAVVTAGQTVLAGETLIDAVATGRYAVQGAIRAIGTVRARTWYELTAEAPVTQSVKTYTGKETSRWALIFGKNRINFYRGCSICQANCDKIIKEHKLSIEGVFTLPVTLVREITRSYSVDSQPTQGTQNELESALEKELAHLVGDDGSVISKDCTATETDGLLRVTLRTECEQQIGTAVPLTDAELATIESQILNTKE